MSLKGTHHQRSLMLIVAILALSALALSGCGSDKTAILGKWTQAGCENKSGRYLGMTASGWHEIEFLKGDTVILENNGSWNYSFPQSGYLNIGGNMGVTYQYEIKGNSLTMREGDDSCVFQRMGSSATQTAGSGTLLWALLVLLAAGAAIVYFLVRRGGRRKTAPAGTASPERPVQQAFCMHCGQPIQAGSRFCQHCGKPLL